MYVFPVTSASFPNAGWKESSTMQSCGALAAQLSLHGSAANGQRSSLARAPLPCLHCCAAPCKGAATVLLSAAEATFDLLTWSCTLLQLGTP